MALIIGLTGRAKSGKTTTAEAMQKYAAGHNVTCEVYEFSHYILQDLKDENKVPQDATRDTVDVKLLVEWGSKRRKENKNYWTHRILEGVLRDGCDVAIIPNVRFRDEAAIIKANDGYIVRVRTLVEEGVDWISPDRDPNHPSETESASIKADFFIQTLRGQETLLRSQAKEIFKYILTEEGL